MAQGMTPDENWLLQAFGAGYTPEERRQLGQGLAAMQGKVPVISPGGIASVTGPTTANPGALNAFRTGKNFMSQVNNPVPGAAAGTGAAEASGAGEQARPNEGLTGRNPMEEGLRNPLPFWQRMAAENAPEILQTPAGAGAFAVSSAWQEAMERLGLGGGPPEEQQEQQAPPEVDPTQADRAMRAAMGQGPMLQALLGDQTIGGMMGRQETTMELPGGQLVDPSSVPQRPMPESGEDLTQQVMQTFLESRPDGPDTQAKLSGSLQGALGASNQGLGTMLLGAATGGTQAAEQAETELSQWIQQKAQMETQMGQFELGRQDQIDQATYQNRMQEWQAAEARREQMNPKFEVTDDGVTVITTDEEGNRQLKRYQQKDFNDVMDRIEAVEKFAGTVGGGGPNAVRLAGEKVAKDEIGEGAWPTFVLGNHLVRGMYDVPVKSKEGSEADTLFQRVKNKALLNMTGAEDLETAKSRLRAGEIKQDELEIEMQRQAVKLLNDPRIRVPATKAYLQSSRRGMSQPGQQ